MKDIIMATKKTKEMMNNENEMEAVYGATKALRLNRKIIRFHASSELMFEYYCLVIVKRQGRH